MYPPSDDDLGLSACICLLAHNYLWLIPKQQHEICVSISSSSHCNCTHLSLWAGRTPGQLRRRRADREWWRWRWSRGAGVAWQSGRWCPGRGWRGSRRRTPSASSPGTPWSPIPHSPWSCSGLACRFPEKMKWHFENLVTSPWKQTAFQNQLWQGNRIQSCYIPTSLLGS